MKREHLSLPFILEPTKPGAEIPGYIIKSDVGSDGTQRPVPYPVAKVWEGQGAERKRQHRATAEFMVHACNSYYSLIAACEVALELLDPCDHTEYEVCPTCVLSTAFEKVTQ